jgi:hypothetical protein
MLELRTPQGPTGRLLREMLAGKKLLAGHVKAIVNYGYGDASHLPTLNANAGRANKYQELVKLDDKGVRTIPFSSHASDLHGVILGRKLHHTQGKDIIFGVGHNRDYFTQLVPKHNEFRVWVFRGKHLATYEKKLDYPGKYGKRGRSKEVWNWHNGFAFHFVQPEQVQDKLKTLAINAVAALDLDFGAVDILLGADRRYYVLEVNTAPGTQGAARQGITSLVNCIERWAKGGFPERN